MSPLATLHPSQILHQQPHSAQHGWLRISWFVLIGKGQKGKFIFNKSYIVVMLSMNFTLLTFILQVKGNAFLLLLLSGGYEK